MNVLNPRLLADLLDAGLSEGQAPYITLISNSMAPLFWAGDEVRLAPAAVADLKPGMIILLAGEQHFLVHRYWYQEMRAGTTLLFTRGDRPEQFDPPQPANRLVGRINARRRQGQVLELDHGRGRQLDQHLAHLAAWEWRWLLQAPRRGRRLPRRLLWYWARLATKFFTT